MISFQVPADTVYLETVNSFSIWSSGKTAESRAGHSISDNSHTFHTTTAQSDYSWGTSSVNGPSATISRYYSTVYDYLFVAAGEYPEANNPRTGTTSKVEWTISNATGWSSSSSSTYASGATTNWKDDPPEGYEDVAAGASASDSNSGLRTTWSVARTSSTVAIIEIGQLAITDTGESWISEVISTSSMSGTGTNTGSLPTTSSSWKTIPWSVNDWGAPLVTTTHRTTTTVAGSVTGFDGATVKYSTVYVVQDREGLVGPVGSGIQTSFVSATATTIGPATQTTSSTTPTYSVSAGFQNPDTTTAYTFGGVYPSAQIEAVEVPYILNPYELPHSVETMEEYSTSAWSFIGASGGVQSTPVTRSNLVSVSVDSTQYVGTTGLYGFYQSSTELALISTEDTKSQAGTGKRWVTPLQKGAGVTTSPLHTASEWGGDYTSRSQQTDATSADAGASKTGLVSNGGGVGLGYPSSPTVARMHPFVHMALPPGTVSGSALGAMTASVYGIVSEWGLAGRSALVELPSPMDSAIYRSSSLTADNAGSTTSGTVAALGSVGSSFSFGESSHVAAHASVGLNKGVYYVQTPSGVVTSIVTAPTVTSWTHPVNFWPAKAGVANPNGGNPEATVTSQSEPFFMNAY